MKFLILVEAREAEFAKWQAEMLRSLPGAVVAKVIPMKSRKSPSKSSRPKEVTFSPGPIPFYAYEEVPTGLVCNICMHITERATALKEAPKSAVIWTEEEAMEALMRKHYEVDHPKLKLKENFFRDWSRMIKKVY